MNTVRISIESENIKGNKTVKTTITEILEGINSRLDDAEEQISDLEDRVVEMNQAEQKKRI